MITLSHRCRHPSIILVLPIMALTPPLHNQALPSVAEVSPPWVGDRIVNMTPLRNLTLVLCGQIYHSRCLYIVRICKNAGEKIMSTSFPFCFVVLEDAPATAAACPFPFPTATASFCAFYLAFATIASAFFSSSWTFS